MHSFVSFCNVFVSTETFYLRQETILQTDTQIPIYQVDSNGELLVNLNLSYYNHLEVMILWKQKT